MEATGLVEVGLPFWCSRQWRVTVPAKGHVKIVREEQDDASVAYSAHSAVLSSHPCNAEPFHSCAMIP